MFAAQITIRIQAPELQISLLSGFTVQKFILVNQINSLNLSFASAEHQPALGSLEEHRATLDRHVPL